MIVKTVSFVTSIAQASKYAEVSASYSCWEICVVGRSNVGKSSFINCLAKQNKLAKTSSSPGRTRLVNLFDFNEGEFMLVDLPGYGYAQAAKDDKRKWGELIEGYLNASTKLKHVFALVDIRHEPSLQDKQMLKFLYYSSLPFTVVATKSDKLSKAQLGRAVQTIAASLSIGKDNIIPISAQSGFNRDAVLKRIEEVLTIV